MYVNERVSAYESPLTWGRLKAYSLFPKKKTKKKQHFL